jgi:hypothetical protein
MHTFDPLCVFSSDLPGVNPTTLNRIILYYRLMTKWSGLGDSMELSRMGLSPKEYNRDRQKCQQVGKYFILTLPYPLPSIIKSW